MKDKSKTQLLKEIVELKKQNAALKNLNDMYCNARKYLGFPGFGTGFFTQIDKHNRVDVTNFSISSDLQSKLKAEFKGDILLLSELTGRDLSSWLA